MTKEEYHTTKRDYRIFGWVLLSEAILAFGFWIFVINHLNPKK